jgi:hypothetical protein
MPRVIFVLWMSMAAVSAVVLSPVGHGIVLFCMLSFVGIPFAFILMAVPTVYLFVFISSLIGILFGGRIWWHYAVGAISAMVVLTGIPYVANSYLERQVRLLANRDVNTLSSGKIGRLAIILPGQPSSSEPICGGLCQRVLLNSNVKELIVAQTSWPNPEDLEIRGILFQRYHADRCQVERFEAGGMDYSPAGENRRLGEKSPADLLALQMANGNCLRRSYESVSTADVVIVQEGYGFRSFDPQAGWDIWGWNISHAALIALQRREGELTVTYRHTVIHSNPLFPILAPTITGIAFNGFGKNSIGFLRHEKVAGADSKYQRVPGVGEFLVDRLGFDLSLHDAGAEEQTLDLAARALKPDHLGDNGVGTAIRIVFSSVAHNRTASEGEIDLAARLLEDGNIPLPEDTVPATRRIVKERPQHIEAISRGLFARFDVLSHVGTKDGRYQLYRCAQAIATLPPSAVRTHFSVVERVAGDPQLREIAGPLLRHLSSFGGRGVPLALALIEDSWRFREPGRPVTNAWEAAYLPGLTALCRLGPEANSALSKLQALRAAGRIADHGSYERLWEDTLQSLQGTDVKGPFACSF